LIQRQWLQRALLVAVVALLGACVGSAPASSSTPPAASDSVASPTEPDCGLTPQPSPVRITLAPSQYVLNIGNDTALTITVTVNGASAVTVAPHAGAELRPANLPTLPWDVRAFSPSGRLLLSLAAHPGDLWREPCAENVLAARVDLSCGRLDIYVTIPVAGPVPGPGKLGDCDP
jgi:hypothetical protein